ncbi:acyltransferase family protein [Mycolicibacterium vaccae]|uniref:acyltransferase family protein n=1 Tax=Mycolicibacterium vaccae TaxID=1810 RepID=UPI003CF3DEA5
MGDRRRLWALDGLRGLAALAVVAYHYLDRGPHLYPQLGQSYSWIEWGKYGVQLFFIISGFVIFDSVRASTSTRFLVNRAIRLYPAYWLAVLLTFIVVSLYGLPGRETTLPVALFNLTMLEGFFGVPYVDGAYWTLAVELAFYAVIVFLARLNALRDGVIFITLSVWLGLLLAARAVALILPDDFGAFELLEGIAYWLPVFIIGIALNIGYHGGRWLPSVAIIIAALSVLTLGEISMLPPLAASVILVTISIYLQLPTKVRPVSDYLGELSYPVYLLHQNIGYVLLLGLAAFGVPQIAATLVAAACAIGVATIAAYLFDIPIRNRLRRLVPQSK